MSNYLLYTVCHRVCYYFPCTDIYTAFSSKANFKKHIKTLHYSAINYKNDGLTWLFFWLARLFYQRHKLNTAQSVNSQCPLLSHQQSRPQKDLVYCKLSWGKIARCFRRLNHEMLVSFVREIKNYYSSVWKTVLISCLDNLHKAYCTDYSVSIYCWVVWLFYEWMNESYWKALPLFSLKSWFVK